MGNPSLIDNRLRQQVYVFCMQESQKEIVGAKKDAQFLFDHSWLKDTSVSEYLVKKRGQWEIHLVFADTKFPFQLIKKRIATSPTFAMAQRMGYYYKRTTGRDKNGTLHIDPNYFKVVLN